MAVAGLPFGIEDLRPFVAVRLHEIAPPSAEVPVADRGDPVAELEDALGDFLDAFDVRGDNPYQLSANPRYRGVIPRREPDEKGLALTGIWFRRETAPQWLGARRGDVAVRDFTHHLLLVAVRHPHLAVLGTHATTRDLLSGDLEQGFCGKRQLGFVARQLEQVALERAFVGGSLRTCWLAGVHAPVATKADRKTLVGRDLRYALDPFDDQTFTYTTVVNVLPSSRAGSTPAGHRRNGRGARRDDGDRFAFRVGVAPEHRKVWTLQARDFPHLCDELHLLFDTLERARSETESDNIKFGLDILARPSARVDLAEVRHAYDVDLDLPSPVEAGGELDVGSEWARVRESWRAHGRLEVAQADEESAAFTVRIVFAGEPVQERELVPVQLTDDQIGVQMRGWQGREHHQAVHCFDTLVDVDPEARLVVRYDSGHVVRGGRIFKLGWQEVLFEGWRWAFEPDKGGLRFAADREKPPEGDGGTGLPERKAAYGWQRSLGTGTPGRTPVSLFEYVVRNVDDLFSPEGGDWYLCCDDGPGEVADFVYFEPAVGRLWLVHVKGAGSGGSNRGISVSAYEQVVAQATKNVRFLDVANLEPLLRGGQVKGYPVAACCFRNGVAGPVGNRHDLLAALSGYRRRLLDRRVIVLQPHVRRRAWRNAEQEWLDGVVPSRHNQIHRFLQLRTLLADAEVLCRKVGVRFEVWGEA